MNAREYLSGPGTVRYRLECAKQKAASLKSLTERVTAAFGPETVAVSHTRNTSAMEEAAIRLMEAEEEVARLKAELAEAELDVGMTISQVEDPQLQELLIRRYLENVTVSAIAAEAGFTVCWGLGKHALALEKVQEILDARGNR